MSILSGGRYSAGAIRLADIRVPRRGMIGTLRTHQITSPGPSTDALNQWIRLVQDPTGANQLVLQTRIAQQDYVAVPTRSGKSAEANGRATSFLYTWGEERIHYWKVMVDPYWVTYAAETGTIFAQVHEVGTSAPAGQTPNIYFEFDTGNINAVQGNATYPDGRVVMSKPFTPGMVFDMSIRCRWRDGIHYVPWGTGLIEIYFNGCLAFRDEQEVNCWPDAGDATQPFMVAGVYQPNEAAGWWPGRQRVVYHIGQATGDRYETHESLARFVEADV